MEQTSRLWPDDQHQYPQHTITNPTPHSHLASRTYAAQSTGPSNNRYSIRAQSRGTTLAPFSILAYGQLYYLANPAGISTNSTGSFSPYALEALEPRISENSNADMPNLHPHGISTLSEQPNYTDQVPNQSVFTPSLADTGMDTSDHGPALEPMVLYPGPAFDRTMFPPWTSEPWWSRTVSSRTNMPWPVSTTAQTSPAIQSTLPNSRIEELVPVLPVSDIYSQPHSVLFQRGTVPLAQNAGPRAVPSTMAPLVSEFDQNLLGQRANKLCPVLSCRRAYEPFSRRDNLLVHVRSVHNLDIPTGRRQGAGTGARGSSASVAGRALSARKEF
ncbi:hypothetical protein BJ508DRAFT_378541 [Ascobolus immersus RN42]|uniref:Uncharacterized protein n=1 Tax=Ascobolus immersus RN42 TaxID=1160509 RepID=A0A3N4HXY3_ASCIM|nr:hypothetical protein BJ508DRAFT_378541 [Ascobolus immersus RN42]